MAGRGCIEHVKFRAGCEQCQHVARRYHHRRHAAIAAGTWQYPVPIREVRAHIEQLVRRGMSVRAIGRAAYVSECTLTDIRNDRRRRTVTGHIAAQILAVPLPAAGTPPRAGLVDATATRRRIQAMAWMGHPVDAQAREVGVNPPSMHRIVTANPRWRRQWVTVDVEQRIAALYDRWSLTRREITGNNVRATAIKHGWHGPYAWDDETIGDPKTKPQVDAPRPRRTDVLASNVEGAVAGDFTRAELTTAEAIEVVERLSARGWDGRRIGEWLRWGDTPEQRRDNANKFRRDHDIGAAPELARLIAITELKQRREYTEPGGRAA